MGRTKDAFKAKITYVNCTIGTKVHTQAKQKGLTKQDRTQIKGLPSQGKNQAREL